MAALLCRLGAFGARRRRMVMLGWLIVLAAVAALGIAFGGSPQNTDSIPGSPAETALTRMDQHWPSPDTQSAQVVFQAPPGHRLAEPGLQELLHTSLAAAGRVPGVIAVGDPAADGMISPDGRTAVAESNSIPPRTKTYRWRHWTL